MPSSNDSVLSRYPRTGDGRLVIDISVARMADLYNIFDRTAPLASKDLNQGLVEYLLESVREIGKADFIVRIRFQSDYPPEMLAGIRQSIGNFFRYLEALQHRRKRRALYLSVLLAVFGGALFAVSGMVDKLAAGSFAGGILSEGIIVAAWVALWEAVATFLIRFPGDRRQRGLYRRLAAAEIEFFCAAQQRPGGSASDSAPDAIAAIDKTSL